MQQANKPSAEAIGQPVSWPWSGNPLERLNRALHARAYSRDDLLYKVVYDKLNRPSKFEQALNAQDPLAAKTELMAGIEIQEANALPINKFEKDGNDINYGKLLLERKYGNGLLDKEREYVDITLQSNYRLLFIYPLALASLITFSLARRLQTLSKTFLTHQIYIFHPSRPKQLFNLIQLTKTGLVIFNLCTSISTFVICSMYVGWGLKDKYFNPNVYYNSIIENNH